MGQSDASRAILVGIACLAVAMAMMTMRRSADNKDVMLSCKGTVVTERAPFGDDIKRCVPVTDLGTRSPG